MGRDVQYDFSAGIVSPEIQGRRESDPYARGMRRLRNATTKTTGAMENREGGEFVGYESHAHIGMPTEITNNGVGGLMVAAGHDFVTGERVLITNMDNSPEIDGKEFTVSFVTATDFQLTDDDGNNPNPVGVSTFGMAQRIDPTNVVRCVNFNVPGEPGYSLYFGNKWMMPVRSGGHELDSRSAFPDTKLHLKRMSKTSPIVVQFTGINAAGTSTVLGSAGGHPNAILPGDEFVIGSIPWTSSNEFGGRISGHRFSISFKVEDATHSIASLTPNISPGPHQGTGLIIDLPVPSGLGSVEAKHCWITGVTGTMGENVNDRWWWVVRDQFISTRLYLVRALTDGDSRMAASFRIDRDDDATTWDEPTGAVGTLRFASAHEYILNETDATNFTGNYPFDDPTHDYTECHKITRIDTPYTSSELQNLRFSQDGEDLIIVAPGHVQKVLRRVPRVDLVAGVPIDWELFEEDFVPENKVVVSNTVLGLNTRRVAVTVVSRSTGEESFPDYRHFDANAAVNIRIVGFPREDVFEYNVYTSLADKLKLGFNTVTNNRETDIDTLVTPDFATRPPEHPHPFMTRGEELTIAAITNGVGTSTPVATITGLLGFLGVNARVYIEDATGTTVINDRTHFVTGLYGFAGMTLKEHVLLNQEIERDLGVYGINSASAFVLSQTIFPEAVGHFGQRRIYTVGKTIYCCRTGAPSSFEKNRPARATDAFSFAIDEAEDSILHIIGTKHMLVFTSGGVWVVSNDDFGATLTLAGVRVAGDYKGGIANVKPILVGTRVLFYTETGPTLRDMSFDGLTEQYSGRNLSLLAPHLTKGYTVRDMSYTAEPDSIVWTTRSDGVQLGMTYDPETEIRGWHQHDTPHGNYESTTNVREGAEDARYDVVNRKLPNHRRRRYFERRLSRELLGDIRNSFNVDCGVRIQGNFESGEVFAETPLKMSRAAVQVITSVVGTTCDIVHWVRRDGERVPGPHHKKRYEFKQTAGGVFTFRHTGTLLDVVGTDIADDDVLEFGVYQTSSLLGVGSGAFQHLIGETVDLFANGSIYKGRVVSSTGLLSATGLVELSQASVGFTPTSDFQSLPPESQDPRSPTGIGVVRSTKRVILLLHESHRGYLAPTEETIAKTIARLRQLKQETDADFENEIKLISDSKTLDMESARGDGTWFYRHQDPTPVTILAAVTIDDG